MYMQCLKFVKFGGQMSKNVRDVRMVCPETTLCVYVCFVNFFVLFLYEIHVRGVKLIENHNWVGKVRKIIPKDHLRVLEEGPKTIAKTVQAGARRWSSRRLMGLLTPRRRVLS